MPINFRDSKSNLDDYEPPTPHAKASVSSPNFREVKPQVGHALTEQIPQLQIIVMNSKLRNVVVEPRPDLSVAEERLQLQHTMKPQLEQNVVSESQLRHAVVVHNLRPSNLNFDDAFSNNVYSVLPSVLATPSTLDFDLFGDDASAVLPLSPVKFNVKSTVPAPSSALAKVCCILINPRVLLFLLRMCRSKKNDEDLE